MSSFAQIFNRILHELVQVHRPNSRVRGGAARETSHADGRRCVAQGANAVAPIAAEIRRAIYRDVAVGLEVEYGGNFLWADRRTSPLHLLGAGHLSHHDLAMGTAGLNLPSQLPISLSVCLVWKDRPVECSCRGLRRHACVRSPCVDFWLELKAKSDMCVHQKKNADDEEEIDHSEHVLRESWHYDFRCSEVFI